MQLIIVVVLPLVLFLTFSASQKVVTDVNVTLYGGSYSPPWVQPSALSLAAPLSFATPLARADVASGERLLLYAPKLAQTFDTQFTCLVRYNDGSCRHAHLATVLPPSTVTGVADVLQLLLTTTTTPAPPPITLSTAIARFNALNIDAKASFQFASTSPGGGGAFQCDVNAIMTSSSASLRIAGHRMAELTARDFVRSTSSNVAHPYLECDVVVRVFMDSDMVNVDFSIENTRTKLSSTMTCMYESSSCITHINTSVEYDVSLNVGPASFQMSSLFHHWSMRWRLQHMHPLTEFNRSEVFFVAHNARYLFYTRAIPTYDIDHKTVTDNEVAAQWTNWQQGGSFTHHTPANLLPLGSGVLQFTMGMAGGREDIGLNPNWVARFLFRTSSWQLWHIAAHAADATGSFPAHLRSEVDGKIISIEENPHITVYGNGYQPLNNKTWPYNVQFECAHQPQPLFLPYLLTACKYYEDGLTYWPVRELVQANKGADYREFQKGVIKKVTSRGLAWCLRSMVQSALYLPDWNVFRDQFGRHANNTIAFWLSRVLAGSPFFLDDYYTRGLNACPDHSQSVSACVSPWMLDFLSTVMQHVVELLLPSPPSDYLQFRDFVSRQTTQRFTHPAVFDPSWAANYRLALLDTSNQYFSTWQDVWYHSYSDTNGNRPKLFDGLGPAGKINPMTNGLGYVYVARGSLLLLSSSGGFEGGGDVPNVAAALDYLLPNTNVQISHYKWAFSGQRGGSPFGASTGAPTPSPTPPTTAPPTPSPTAPTVTPGTISSSDNDNDGTSSGTALIVGLVIAFVVTLAVGVVVVFFILARRRRLSATVSTFARPNSSAIHRYSTASRRSSAYARRGGGGGGSAASRTSRSSTRTAAAPSGVWMPSVNPFTNTTNTTITSDTMYQALPQAAFKPRPLPRVPASPSAPSVTSSASSLPPPRPANPPASNIWQLNR